MSRQLGSGSFSKGALVLASGQALALWWLHQSIDSGVWPATAPGGLFAAYLVAVFLPLTLLVLWAHRHDRVLWVSGVAVAAFLAGQIGFLDIAALVEATMTAYVPEAPTNLEDLFSIDAAARQYASTELEKFARDY